MQKDGLQVFNAMNTIQPRPYVVKDNRNLKKKNEDDNSRSNTQEAGKEGQNPGAKSRGLNYVEQKKSTNVNGINAYSPSPSAFVKPAGVAGVGNVNPNSVSVNRVNAAQTSAPSHVANVGASSYANISPKINIAQIVKDFKNTAIAIGAPEDISEEVNGYLSLVVTQTKKDEPNTKLVQSNLKNASIILDKYISETLQKESKVVSNWVDALFLQQVNYKYDENEINKDFLVKFPEKNQPEAEQPVENEKVTEQVSIEPAEVKEVSAEVAQSSVATPKEFSVPSDKALRTMFIKAKKFAYANDSEKAMVAFHGALERAVEVEDKETQSKIRFEIGQIYDKNDYLAQALNNYNQALNTTSDLNIKAKAHYSMAQIYDDVKQFEPAVAHYLTSVSYAGESDNLAAQSTSLTKVGNIFADKYNRIAFELYDSAQEIAEETNNPKVKGFVYSNRANAHNRFNEPKTALKFYCDAAKNYLDDESPEKVAINYKRAAELMADYNNPEKSKALYNKALKFATKSENECLTEEITRALAQKS